MNREMAVQVVKRQVMTSAEVAQTLGVTRQHLSNLDKNGKLSPVKKARACDIYLRCDVEKYKMDYYMGGYSREIIGRGCTSICEEYIEKNVDSSKVEAIYVYFRGSAAIMDGFYVVDEQAHPDELLALRAPTFVIQYSNLDQEWLDGLNCNYNGMGPNGSNRVLRGIFGVPQEIASYVYKYPVIKYYRENENWRAVFEREENIVKNDSPITKKYNDAQIYRYNNKLVKICQRTDKYWDNYDIELFARQYLSFLPFVNDVTIYPLEMAYKTGHCITSSVDDCAFQVVLSDGYDREIWINSHVEDNVPIESNEELVEILKSLGFDIEFDESKARNSLITYFKEIFRRKARVTNISKIVRIDK